MIKQIVRQLISHTGFDLHRKTVSPPAGSVHRGVGDFRSFFEDIAQRGFKPRGIIDVGAHKGDWTRLVRSTFPSARSLMIEPQQEMVPWLNAVCADLPGSEFVLYGAAAAPGTLVQTIWADLAGSSFVPTADDAEAAGRKQRLVPITTIDIILADRRDFNPDLVKLDIQGYEIEALKGGLSLFGQTEVFIIETSLFETMSSRSVLRDIVQFMHAHGYEVYDIVGYLRRPLDGALGQVDLAFAKRDGLLRASSAWSQEE